MLDFTVPPVVASNALFFCMISFLVFFLKGALGRDVRGGFRLTVVSKESFNSETEGARLEFDVASIYEISIILSAILPILVGSLCIGFFSRPWVKL